MSRWPFAILAFLCAATVAGAQDKGPKISWMIHPTKTQLKLGEQVLLASELKNLSASQILIGTSPQISGEMQLDLIGPNGTRALWEGAVAATGPSCQVTILDPSRSLAGAVA